MKQQDKQQHLYNTEYKCEYLKTIQNEKTFIVVESFFVITAPIERLLKKDLCEFNFSDFIMLFERCGFAKGYNFPNRKSMVKSYITWCAANKFCSSNSVVEIERLRESDVSGYHMTKSKYFKSLDELLDCIEQIYHAVSSDVSPTLYEPMQMFYGLYWYGLDSEEIYEMKPSQVNVYDSTITTERSKITLCERFAAICNRVCKQDHFITLHNQVMFFVPSPYVFKSSKEKMANAPINDNFHITKHRAWKKMMEEVPISHPYYGKILSTVSIAESGRFYRYYQDEEKGIKIDQEYLKKQMGESYQYAAYRFELRNYQMWKGYCNL